MTLTRVSLMQSRLQRGEQRVPQLPRIPTCHLGRSQRGVGRPIAVLAPGWALDHDARREGVDAKRRHRGGDGFEQLIADQGPIVLVALLRSVRFPAG